MHARNCVCTISHWINPRPASASRALLRLIPCHRSYRSPSLWRAFGYYRLPWIDGRWVQDLRTYSPRSIWPAITSKSNFMGSSCSPQSELAHLFLGLAQGYPVATRCMCDYTTCVAQDIRGTCWPGVILTFLSRYKVQMFQVYFVYSTHLRTEAGAVSAEIYNSQRGLRSLPHLREQFKPRTDDGHASPV